LCDEKKINKEKEIKKKEKVIEINKLIICIDLFIIRERKLNRMPRAKDPVEILQVKKLLHCVRTEDYYQIKKLCEKGVEFLINYNEPHEGLTALILASIMNNEKMLQFLLERGAHPNIVDFHVIQV
jgi:hypothetical protein